MAGSDRQPVFFYDLGDPGCYLVAERVNEALGVVPEWEPVHAAGAGIQLAAADAGEVAGRAAALQLQAVRWPAVWPADTAQAMLAATYAKHIGRAVAFSLAAFRQAFAGGRDLGELDTVLIAGAACEIHPAALNKGMALHGVRDGLEAAGTRAREAGVERLPAVWLRGEVVQGAECVTRVCGPAAQRT